MKLYKKNALFPTNVPRIKSYEPNTTITTPTKPRQENIINPSSSPVCRDSRVASGNDKISKSIINMEKEIRKLIELNLIRDIQIEILKEKKEGMIINEDIINNILQDFEVKVEQGKE